MREDIRILDESISGMSLEEMAAEFHRILVEYDEQLSLQAEKERATHEMSLQFSQMKSEAAGYKKENARLKEELVRLSDQLNLRNRDLFGRTTEKTETIMHSDPVSEQNTDPISEDLQETAQEKDVSGTNVHTGCPQHGKSRKHGKKTKGKRQEDLSKLPKKTEFLLDIAALDEEYGTGNWRIYGWNRSDEICCVPYTEYLKTTYTPIISVGLEHQLVRVHAYEKLLPHSLVSSSLLAAILYNKCVLSVPFYRQSASLALNDVIISRQNMTNWTIRFAREKFLPVVQYLELLLLETGYNQVDESTLKVISDGRSAGSVSYVWVHTTSELYTGNPITVFCYELTRSTQHLRDFYLSRDYSGVISSDAYVSYDLLEEEAGGKIWNTHCFMHSRRRFVTALLILRLKDSSMTRAQMEELPEGKALLLIDAIYEAETPLKELAPEERRERRNSEVRPKVKAFFEYLHSLDADSPAFSDRMRDAIQYSLRNEEKLRAFLDDPMIPCDNGKVERSIRPWAVGRHNWLFCFSVDGAEALTLVYSLVETAKQNHAHPYYYLMYLLEKMPVYSQMITPELLKEMVPWSDAYVRYEKEKKQEVIQHFSDQSLAIAPKTPTLKDREITGVA